MDGETPQHDAVDVPPDRPAPVRRWWWLEGLVFFLLGRALLTAVAFASKNDPWLAKTWIHWDAHLYLMQARDGIDLIPCTRSTGYAPHDWCGTAGWMPAFPWLVRMLGKTGIPLDRIASVLPACFHLVTVLLVSRVVASSSHRVRWPAVALAVVFPGIVYAHAAFPISMCHAALVAALWTLSERRWWLAGGFGALASLSYSTGFLFAGVAAVEAVLAWRREEAIRNRLAPWVVPVLAIAGLLAVFVIHQAATGRWNAFFLVQKKYGHGVANPVVTWWTSIAQPWTEWEVHKRWAGLQSMLVTLVVAVTAWVGVRLREDALVRVSAVAVLAWWCFPLVMGQGVALFRAEVMLLPAVFVVSRASLWASVPLVVLSTAMLVPMGWNFFVNALR